MLSGRCVWFATISVGILLFSVPPILAQVTEESVTVLDGRPSVTPPIPRFPRYPDQTPEAGDFPRGERVLTTTTIGSDQLNQRRAKATEPAASPPDQSVRSIYQGPSGQSVAPPAPVLNNQTRESLPLRPRSQSDAKPEVAKEADVALTPTPAPAESKVTRRFDDLPAEGAKIAAYDDLLADGLDAAQENAGINEITALQLNEWIAQMRAAVDGHPSVRAAQLQAKASEAGVDQARAARMPQITLSSEVGNDRSVRDGGDPTSAGGIGEERDLQVSPSLDASLLLFDAGSSRAGIDAAQQRVEAEDIAAVAAADQIGFRAAQTLVNLATLRAQIRLAEENLNEVRRLRAMIQERADAGRDSPSDLFRMKSRVEEARNTLEQRIAEFNAARADYAEVFRSDPIVLGLPPAFIPVPESAQTAIKRAVGRNPQLAQANALAAAAQREVDARKAGLWPQVSLGATVTGYDVTREGEDYYDSFIGFRVNAPLFDGGSRRAQLEQQQRQASLEQARVDELRAQVVQSISEAYSSRASLKPQLRSLENQVTANQSTLKAYEEQFLAGRRPLNDLVSAQRELYTARADLLDTEGELHLQHFSIRRLTGDLLTAYGLSRSG